MRIQVRLDGETIAAASFGTYGCVPAIACGSFITEWVTGRPVGQALEYSADDLRHALGGLPTGRRYCADLAVDALRAAIHDAIKQKGVER
jgi:NifU-like protein involved in Fe-S cluster formation